jgi:hypothetical protein
MGRACSTNGIEERVEVIGGRTRGKEKAEYGDIGGWILLRWR